MAGKSGWYIKRFVLSLLILLGLALSVFSQDKEISGIINVYKRVEAIGPGLNEVTLNSVDLISPGDTVLLIQMQGVGIDTDPDNYGNFTQQVFGVPGEYEFLLVAGVLGNVVSFTRDILNSYDVAGSVQLVRVPYYNTATVTGELTAQAWDKNEKTGGILAMIVGSKLKLEADINVSGKGFNGGPDSEGAGVCVRDNEGLYNDASYPNTWTNAGNKGEGLAIHDEFKVLLEPLHSKGMGHNLTGGGGGNGKYSGGGGGSNRGKGGDGGTEKNFGTDACGFPYWGGFGGLSVRSEPIANGIFLGSGGGASTHAFGSSGSDGGNGGGIVIIIADTISGNGNYIKAEGATSANAVGDGGAGGGGAGGSIVLSLQSFSADPADSLKISVKGGNGGTNPGGFGGGGGGGGGLFWVSSASVPGKVKVNTDSGIPTPSVPVEGEGDAKYLFNPVLNGFLFNSIRSGITGNQVDSICSNVPFTKISGTIPFGVGNTYEWQSSTVSESVGYVTAPGVSNLPDYSPGIITQTTWFRRVVTQTGPPLIVDRSMPVKVIVHQEITGNTVGEDTIICYGQDPGSLIQMGAGPADGNGYYAFSWIQNLTNSDWENSPDAAGTFTNSEYDPPVLFDTTYYKRIVTSGRCVSYSPVVTVTVLPLISGNITSRVDSVICEGNLFSLLEASAPGGGDLSYKYHWQTSTSLSGDWVDVSGIFDQESYLPDTSDFSTTEQLYFRRVVYSGADSVCQSNSVPIELTRYNKITGNSIAADQTIGSDSIPEPLAGTVPAEGGGDYLYLWESSADASVFNAADPVNSGQNYSPAALTDTTFYRRIVLSGAISKVCKDTSNIVVVNVHKTISNNSIAFISGAVEDTIGLGSTPAVILGAAPAGGSALPDDYDYQWYYSTDNIDWDPVITGGNTQDFQPASLLQTTYFRRDVSSPKATPTSVSVSNIIKITVLPLISNTISGSAVICYGTQPAALETGILSGGDNIYRFVWQDSVDITGWQNIPGGTEEAYQPPALTLPVDYRRIVYSGSDDCCVDTSNVLSIGIYQLPTGILTAISDTVCEGTQVPLNIALTGAAPWEIVYDVNSENSPEIDVATPSVTLNDDPGLPEGSENMTFTYNLETVIDNNGCIATSLSGTRKTVVYKVPVVFAGDDMEVCGPDVTLAATPSVGTGTWTYPAAVVATSVVNPYTLEVTVDSTFEGTDIIHKFYWKEDNWQCSSKDSVEITFYKRISSVNAGPDTALFSFDFITRMVAEPAIVGEGRWSVISGTGYFDSETDPGTKVSDLSPGINTYLWRIENGVCVREDDITVTVSPITIPEGFSPNNDMINDLFIINGLDLNNQIAELQIVNGAGSVVFSTSNSNNQEWTDWDGKNSRGIDLPEGTYYFLLKLSSNNAPGVDYKNSGFVILKRY